MFRHAWLCRQNGVVPIPGYYEWLIASGQNHPYFVTDVDGGALLVAGLRESRGGKVSFTALAEPASRERHALHPRIPVILAPDLAELWLSGDLHLSLLDEGESRTSLRYYRVSTAVNNVRNQGEGLIQSLDEPGSDNDTDC